MKSVEGWIELELRETPEGPWLKSFIFDPTQSIEQARTWMERSQETDTTGAEYRLVYVRVETTREVLD